MSYVLYCLGCEKWQRWKGRCPNGLTWCRDGGTDTSCLMTTPDSSHTTQAGSSISWGMLPRSYQTVTTLNQYYWSILVCFLSERRWWEDPDEDAFDLKELKLALTTRFVVINLLNWLISGLPGSWPSWHRLTWPPLRPQPACILFQNNCFICADGYLDSEPRCH